MAYDQVKTIQITLPEWDFGDGASVDTVAYRVPDEYDAKIIKVGVMLTETVSATVTAPKFEIGSTDGGGEYAALNIADGAADKDCYDETDDTDAIVSANITAGSLIYLSGTVGSSGGATTAGKGLPFVVFELTPAK